MDNIPVQNGFDFWDYLSSFGLGVFVLCVGIVYMYKFFNQQIKKHEEKEEIYRLEVKELNEYVRNLNKNTLKTLSDLSVIIDKLETTQIKKEDLNIIREDVKNIGEDIIKRLYSSK